MRLVGRASLRCFFFMIRVPPRCTLLDWSAASEVYKGKDIRCICCGHLTRLAIWNLRASWDSKKPVMERMEVIRRWYAAFGGLGAVLTALEMDFANAERSQHWAPVGTLQETYEPNDEVSF